MYKLQIYMGNYTFTSEAVSRGHPDKIADQISDAILDACLKDDIYSKVACETLVTDGLVVIAGEITTTADLHVREIVREKIRDIGYDDPAFGFSPESCGIIHTLHKQSPDIARGVDYLKTLGAGDQGMMFGFACDDTPELMPLPIAFAHKILAELDTQRMTHAIPYLGPDAKCQVTVEYNGERRPLRIDTIVLSTQHTPAATQEMIEQDMRKLIKSSDALGMIDAKTRYFINPTGRFVIGGPRGDTGLTGRKIMVDTYGSLGRHGGGAFSGKDPTKVDRSAAYMARFIAKNIVASQLATRCEVELAYAIGVAEPVAVYVNTFDTGIESDENLTKKVQKKLDLSPLGIIKKLDLLRPIYSKTAYGGHFGRNDPDFTWEKIEPELFTH